MKFYNKIDYLRKLGDLFAIFVFLILAYYLYKIDYNKNYKIIYILIIISCIDLYFSIDAIKIHTLQLFNCPEYIIN
jgi:hypothetical protein